MLTSRQTGTALSCAITYDLLESSAPAPGDYLVSHGKTGPGSAYLIVGVRLVKARKPRPFTRWMLTCQRANVTDLIVPGVRQWPMYWYPRDRKRQPVGLKGLRR